MRNPTALPRPGTLHWAWPTFCSRMFKSASRGTRTAGWRTTMDRIGAIGVIALVLATAVLCGLLVVSEVGQYREANAASANPAMLQPPLPGNAGPGEMPNQAAPPRAAIDPWTLTLWSIPVNLLIFVALGLYLRWDSGRKN